MLRYSGDALPEGFNHHGCTESILKPADPLAAVVGLFWISNCFQQRHGTNKSSLAAARWNFAGSEGVSTALV